MIISDYLVLWTYSSNIHRALRFVTNLVLLFAIIYGIEGYVAGVFVGVLFIIPFLLLHKVTILSQRGILLSHTIVKCTCIPWDNIRYFGTVSKKSFGQNTTYLYFSETPLVCAPWEKLPPMSQSFAYIVYQDETADFIKRITKGAIAIDKKRRSHIDKKQFFVKHTDLILSLLAYMAVFFIAYYKTQFFAFFVVFFVVLFFSACISLYRIYSFLKAHSQ